MPLQDETDTDKYGAVFVLRRSPVQDVTIQLQGWSAHVRRGVPAVVVHGDGSGVDLSSTLVEAFEAANNALDYMSFRGLADVTIIDAVDDFLIWWPGPAGVVMHANLIHTVTSHSTATVTVHDANGDLVRTAPPTPLQRDAFRFVRMSRTSDYLHDAYRYMFLALESVLDDIHAHTRGGEVAWFKDALRQANQIEPVSFLAPSGTPDPIDWIYDNMYRPERSGLMHAKASRGYIIPQDLSSRNSIQRSLELLSTYVLNLLEKRTNIGHMSSGLMQGGWEILAGGALSKHRIVLSDDETPFNENDLLFAPGGGRVVELQNGAITRENEPMVMAMTGVCEKSDLNRLDQIRRIGAMGPDDEALLASPLYGPLQLDEDVVRLEVKLGLRNVNSTGSRIHFSA
ncbi:hypothetical protein DFR68_102803 [Nocardia mexicana]|uniref:Uncharacterized protein n=2 Tax=Nocardia mexicana TaxID=279262 RepID=A0A370HCM4_9NOCA|nr:hypothetical protein DFR68_102803 [Nocardia mexicana]